ncbi:MAG: hypothetical protein HKN02_09775 [Rhodobacteraceae bacterium]|nr:hypothetical protein [Paracoccaceae bacterium]
MAAALLVMPGGLRPALAEGHRTLTFFSGVQTDDVWEDAIQFWQAEFLRSGFVGVGLGHDLGQRGRFTFGVEGQIAQHFGLQSNMEINVPLVVRYHRAGRRLPALETMAFGLGLSWASEKPAAEVARDGDSAQVLIYWMAEVQFDLPNTELEAVIRLHHRSDAYGLFDVDSGSNSWVLGLRKRY